MKLAAFTVLFVPANFMINGAGGWGWTGVDVGGGPVMWDHRAELWSGGAGCGSMRHMTAAVVRRFVARRHVDYGRVRSAICPAH